MRDAIVKAVQEWQAENAPMDERIDALYHMALRDLWFGPVPIGECANCFCRRAPEALETDLHGRCACDLGAHPTTYPGFEAATVELRAWAHNSLPDLYWIDWAGSIGCGEPESEEHDCNQCGGIGATEDSSDRPEGDRDDCRACDGAGTRVYDAEYSSVDASDVCEIIFGALAEYL